MLDSPNLVHIKTTALTTAFGLTRLMEANGDNIMTTSDNDGSAFMVSTKHSPSLHQQQATSTMTTSPILSQPKSSVRNAMDEDEQTIFDDDPMEGDSQPTTTVIS